MITSIAERAKLDDEQARAIEMLSRKLHLPVSEVRQVFVKELGRLESQARVHRFLGVLALSSTRSVLRSPDRRTPDPESRGREAATRGHGRRRGSLPSRDLSAP